MLSFIHSVKIIPKATTQICTGQKSLFHLRHGEDTSSLQGIWEKKSEALQATWKVPHMALSFSSNVLGKTPFFSFYVLDRIKSCHVHVFHSPETTTSLTPALYASLPTFFPTALHSKLFLSYQQNGPKS